MLIDWFTIIAQALNFLILVWLLKRFLYKPILHAIDVREKRISDELADADTRKAEARKEREKFEEKNEELDRQRNAFLSRAKDEAEAERRRLIDEARRAANVLRAERQEALKREQQSLNNEIIRRTQEEVFAITRRALTDLAGTRLEERMSDVLRRRLREMNNAAKEGLAKVLKTSSDPVFVRSAFELPSEQRSAIQQTLNEIFSADIQVRFETAPEVISGIELIANGRKIAWSIAGYLASLEKSVGELLKDESKPPAKLEAEPETQAEPKPNSRTKPNAAEESK